LKAICIKLDSSKEIFVQDFEFSRMRSLKIGTRIMIDSIESLNSFNRKIHKKDYHIGTFSDARIINYGDFNCDFYNLNLPSEIENTQLLITDIEGRKTVFFCYELIRAFLTCSPELLPYLTDYETINLFIEEAKFFKNEDDETILKIIFEESMPLKLYRNDNAVREIIQLMFVKERREFYQDFIFSDFKDIKLESIPNILIDKSFTAQIKPYTDFDIILHFDNMKAPIKDPFDYLIIFHPKDKGRGAREKGSKGAKPGLKNNDLPDNNKTGESVDPSQSKESTYSGNLGIYDYSDGLEIKRNKHKPELQDDTTRECRGVFEINDLRNLESGFPDLGSDIKGHYFNINNTDYNNLSTFNDLEIPSGLFRFAKAIELVASDFNLDFNYDLISDKEYKVALKIELNLKQKIYLLEIDSPPNIYISTLVLKSNENGIADEEIQKLVDDCKKYRFWNLELLSNNIVRSDTLRHPKVMDIHKDLDQDEFNKYYIKRLKMKILETIYSFR
jgi:hypothetical protein